MGKTIINAGSQIVNLGVKDNSRVGSLPLQDPTPQHCPKSFIFAARGDVLLLVELLRCTAFLVKILLMVKRAL